VSNLAADMPAPAVRTFNHREFPVDRLVDAKGDQRISVCLPARNEAPTIGPIVAAVRRHLMRKQPLVDEIVVVDDGSTDGTPGRAAAAGARVVSAADVAPEFGPGSGKGNAMWKSLLVTDGDIVVWCDADVRNFRPCFVTGLLGPLLLEDDVQFCKGFYERPLDGVRGQGGRVTELVARPLISLFFPQLSMFSQPLAGEYAARRSGRAVLGATPASPVRSPRFARQCSAAAAWQQATASTSAFSSTWYGEWASHRSPKSTSACASTATAPSTSSGRKRRPCCTRHWPAPGSRPAPTRFPFSPAPGASRKSSRCGSGRRSPSCPQPRPGRPPAGRGSPDCLTLAFSTSTSTAPS